jgi:aminobenzoyl-glutamate utilization protein B
MTRLLCLLVAAAASTLAVAADRPMVAAPGTTDHPGAHVAVQSALQADAAITRMMARLDAGRDTYARVAHQIWTLAEVGYQEAKSSALLQKLLADAGFTVRAGVADIPTAFVGSYGTGTPVLAIVGEFDALPGLSQDAVPRRTPLVENGPGHGCGHHLLGTGSAAAAIAVKDWLTSTGHAGTVRYYGTPAEEGGGGKVYLLRAGLFADVDAVITWHPGDRNEASATSTLANMSAKFRFHGKSSHAASAPDRGRSALDGVEAMNAMVNLMREHVPQETRIHYVITRGGEAPNVVPDFAEVYYYARHPDMTSLDRIWQRIVNAARGAALGTDTTADFEVINGVYNVLPNERLSALQRKNLQRVGGVEYTAEERAFAETLRTSLPDATLPLGSEAVVQPPRAAGGGASTDLGDVSWNVPTVSMTAATWVPGTPAHSWQATACGGMSIGAKGMMVAARTMALSAVDLFADPSILKEASAEFEKRRGAGFVYKPQVGDRKPPIDYRKIPGPDDGVTAAMVVFTGGESAWTARPWIGSSRRCPQGRP